MTDITKRAKKRCAIYTRKSSEEGLDQEFNSLQAQREACEAFITSQKSEGWQVLPTSYDDGGWSGGTLDRPALQQLLADIRASKVDVVVVYKIDRLTRSLFDFAKIVEVFDAHSVSFVSVTQAFNTTTSMGRLTLNVLLSFAQFEREVTGERIRDKIAASKKKGMWMGGFAPLGYDAKDRKLVINEPEAESVRYIFRSYLELGSVYKLKAELEAKGITSKRRIRANGNPRGGCSIAAGALYQMMQNPIYTGRIGYQGEVYEGEHEPIVEPELWEAVQQSLAAKRQERRSGANTKEPSLLAGLIVDSEDRPLTPSHAAKGGKRYRYYVSRSLITDPGRPATSSWRLPATELERVILKQISELLTDQSRIWALFKKAKLSHQEAVTGLKRGNELALNLQRQPSDVVRQLLLHLVKQVVVHEDRIATELRVESLLKQLAKSGANQAGIMIMLTTPCLFRRRGSEMRLVIGDRYGTEGRPDHTLIAAIVRAHAWWQELCGGKVSLKKLADRERSDERYVARVLKLSFLSPDITAAILEGRQPPNLTADMLIKMPDCPSSWALQRSRLDFMVRAPAS
ncbi:hypothetical protein AUC71_02960 [Methyloceanibacter marginalis]|uniref:Resolvase n=2 Tax=Methyloceanibacter marginalis TaxID=1774971 RepID=A0A1E3W8Q1_9HYPH|nr:hypothetical protein AUC71_02960 [Methyloceanibacter marginalis]